jgi:biotin-(acetyl-CoA carboxylase) ligase
LVEAPVFPPLLKGHCVAEGAKAFDAAAATASAGSAGAGDLFWSRDEAVIDIAVVLEPECIEVQALQMLFVAMVAFGDSFGAIAPPEIGVFYRWPNGFEISGASVGRARVCVGPLREEVPEWMVVGITVRNMPYDGPVEPGHDLQRTTLWDEGAGELDHVRMVESFARHLLTWVHNWSEDGFRPVNEAWMGRATGRDELHEIKWQDARHKGVFLAVGEDGQMLLKGKNGTVALPLEPVVERIRAGA